MQMSNAYFTCLLLQKLHLRSQQLKDFGKWIQGLQIFHSSFGSGSFAHILGSNKILASQILRLHDKVVNNCKVPNTCNEKEANKIRFI